MAKINRRTDRGAGHLMVSVPPEWIEDFEGALNHLEGLSRDAYSRIIREVVIAEAQRKGWKMPAPHVRQSGKARAVADPS